MDTVILKKKPASKSQLRNTKYSVVNVRKARHKDLAKLRMKTGYSIVELVDMAIEQFTKAVQVET